MNSLGPKFKKQSPNFKNVNGKKLLLFDSVEELVEYMPTATKTARKSFFKKIQQLKQSRNMNHFFEYVPNYWIQFYIYHEILFQNCQLVFAKSLQIQLGYL